VTPPGNDHGRKVERLFSRITRWYDVLNHLLSFGIDIYWRYRLVRLIPGGEEPRVLDLAAGTMDVAREIHRRRPNARVVAADFCLPMLKRGAGKLHRLAPIHPVCADGLALPFRDESFDAVSIAFGIRNIIPRTTALEEIHRVLRPGGRLCVLEFGSAKKRILRGAYNLYLKIILPTIGRLVSSDKEAYSYLAETVMDFPDEEEFGKELVDSGFERFYYLPLTAGIVYIHVGRKRGEQGLSPEGQEEEQSRQEKRQADDPQSGRSQLRECPEKGGHAFGPEKVRDSLQDQGQAECHEKE
jgi:demethylmenaquinone methyltransferase / 2-methoxy-6-polyprenyl-1,4-benzoquinol methylase